MMMAPKIWPEMMMSAISERNNACLRCRAAYSMARYACRLTIISSFAK